MCVGYPETLTRLVEAIGSADEVGDHLSDHAKVFCIRGTNQGVDIDGQGIDLANDYHGSNIVVGTGKTSSRQIRLRALLRQLVSAHPGEHGCTAPH